MSNKRDQEWLIRDKYGGNDAPRGLKKDLARLAKGEPLAYVIGWSPFLNTKIDLRYKPLIPRPETEYWTEQVINEIRKKKWEILDMCCGSGCIGIAILKNCPYAHVTFSDIDPKALRQTKLNLRLNDIPAKRYRVIRSDVWKNIKRKFDVVVSNPPYIPVGRELDPSVLRFEPRRALFAGPSGLRVFRSLILELAAHLKSKGKAYLEFDAPAKRHIEKLARANGLASRIHKDQFERYRLAELKAR